jgi:2-polyprenyl-3-methyl-5-hydroxy-6-metoxy-1,4-benzoquinol methylase
MNNKWYQQFIVDNKPTTPVGFMNEEYFIEIAKLLPDVKDKKVLDLCCNAGFVSFKLAELGASVIGIEREKLYLDQADSVKCHFNWVSFLQADIEKIDLSVYKPDLILALSCLYHLKNPEEMVRKICDQNCMVIASFRLNNFINYLDLFKVNGRKPDLITNYGKKFAVRFN